MRRCGDLLAYVTDHLLPYFQVGPGQRDQELVAAVTKHLVVRPQVFRDVLHHGGQHLVADDVTVPVVDLLQMVEVHESDAALLHVAAGQLAPLAQRRQHLDAAVGPGQRVAVTQRSRDRVPQRIQFQLQALAAGDEVVIALAGDRHAGGRLTQHLCRDLVQLLVLGLDSGERRLLPELDRRLLVVPPAESTTAMGLLVEVVRVARQAADDRADEVVVPAGMVVRRLVQLVQRFPQ